MALLRSVTVVLAAVALGVAGSPGGGGPEHDPEPILPTPPPFRAGATAPTAATATTVGQCTTVLTKSVPPPAWLPLYYEKTVYASTSTATVEVPCRCCRLVLTTAYGRRLGEHGHGPVVHATATTTATAPATVITQTVCAPEPTLGGSPGVSVCGGDSDGDDDQDKDDDDDDDDDDDKKTAGVAPSSSSAASSTPSSATSSATPLNPTGHAPPASASDCTHTASIFSLLTFGPTSTAWTSTVTRTVSVRCEGCAALVTKRIGGHGPAQRYTTTVTAAQPTTTSAYVCETGGGRFS